MAGPATGRHLAEGLSRVVAETVARTKEATAAGEAAMRNRGSTAFLEGLEKEMAPHIKEAFGWILEQENAPEFLKMIVAEASEPKHQFAAFQQLIMFMSFLITSAFHMGEPMLQAVMNDLWTHAPNLPLSPEQAAMAVLKGWMPQNEGAGEAVKSGMNASRFDHLVKSAGNPPGPEELLMLYRRGLIDLGRFEQGILESHIRPEWFDTYTHRRTDPISPADAIIAAVQSQISPAEAARIASLSGMSGEDFDLMYRTHGNPPGPHEVGEMFHRGILNRADAAQAIRESRIKNKYVEPMLQIAERLAPERSIVMMVAHGALPVAEGIKRLLRLGFSAQEAADLTSEAVNRKHTATRNLAQSQITELYEEGAITSDVALAALKSLNYDPQEAAWLMMLADNQRDKRFQQAAIGKVHTLYVGHKIERPEAGTDLDKLKVPPAQRDRLLAVWDLERTSNVVHLTQAQLSQAYNSEYIDKGRYIAELTRMGTTELAIKVLEIRNRPPYPSGQIAFPG